jgi:hypothetical protein
LVSGIVVPAGAGGAPGSGGGRPITVTRLTTETGEPLTGSDLALKDLGSNAFCVLTTGTNELRWGLDVVVEGDAERVTGREQLQRLAAVWQSKLDWDHEVAGGVFGDAEGRHALVFGVAPTKVFAFTKGAAPSQTRYRLAWPRPA